MSKSKEISQKVINLRKAMRLSQDAFAQQLGLSRNYVSMIEGGREPSPNIIRLIEMLEQQQRLPANPQTPQEIMKAARLRKGLSFADLAKLTRYGAGPLQRVEEGHSRASEEMISRIAKALNLDPEMLMSGSDETVVREPTMGTFGAKPPITVGPDIGRPKYVPLLSMAQAGAMSGSAFTDDSYSGQGTIAFGPKDPHAFGVTIRGDSMSPQYNEGDVAIVYPTWAPQNDKPVICRLKDGDVLFKLYQARDNGQRVVLSSYNLAFPSVEYGRDSFEWIYPVASVLKNILL